MIRIIKKQIEVKVNNLVIGVYDNAACTECKYSFLIPTFVQTRDCVDRNPIRVCPKCHDGYGVARYAEWQNKHNALCNDHVELRNRHEELKADTNKKNDCNFCTLVQELTHAKDQCAEMQTRITGLIERDEKRTKYFKKLNYEILELKTENKELLRYKAMAEDPHSDMKAIQALKTVLTNRDAEIREKSEIIVDLKVIQGKVSDLLGRHPWNETNLDAAQRVVAERDLLISRKEGYSDERQLWGKIRRALEIKGNVSMIRTIEKMVKQNKDLTLKVANQEASIKSKLMTPRLWPIEYSYDPGKAFCMRRNFDLPWHTPAKAERDTVEKRTIKALINELRKDHSIEFEEFIDQIIRKAEKE